MTKTKTYNIKKKNEVLLVEVGNEECPPTTHMLEKVHRKMLEAVRKKSKVITFPYWVSISTLKKMPKELEVVKAKKVKSEKKVYCKDCHWSWSNSSGLEEGHNRCRCPTIKEKYEKDTSYERVIPYWIFIGVNNLNKKNNCEHYKEKEEKKKKIRDITFEETEFWFKLFIAAAIGFTLGALVI